MIEERTPLVVPGDDEAEAAAALNAVEGADNTARTARMNVLHEAVPWGPNTSVWARMASTLLLAPQVLCAMAVLSSFTSENCLLDAHMSLRTWIIGDSLQKSLQLLLIWFPFFVQRRGVLLTRRQLRTLRFLMLWNDVFAIVWLVQGSTLFSSPSTDECRNVHAPHVYNLGLGMLILSLLAVSLPLILCAAMVPLVCFCLPCFIRIILAARAARPKGASPERLASLPSVVYEHGSLLGGEAGTAPSCAICLAGYANGEELRCLPCDVRHHFHRKCVDDWLLLNASCPICRKGVFDIQSTAPSASAAPQTRQPPRTLQQRGPVDVEAGLLS